MSSLNNVDKIVLGILFGAVIITVIGYERYSILVGENYCKACSNYGDVTEKELIDKVNVDVYYESFCTDSKSFFIDQLAPAMRLLGDRISLKIIPYGKSNTLFANGVTKFRCQHGPRECLGNKYHSCLIDRTTTNANLQLRVIICLFENVFFPIDASVLKCCRRHGLDFSDIKACANGQEGTNLLIGHGLSTKTLDISFIPTIVLNRVHGGKHYQSEILKDTSRELCKIFKYNSTNDRQFHDACATNSDSGS